MGDHPQALAGRVVENTPETALATHENSSSKQGARVRAQPVKRSEASPRARLLLVDDEPDTRRSLSRQLRQQGYYVDVAVGGAEAVEYVDHTSYDVILSDIRMPDMDGIELLQEVRRHDLHVPVVLLTASPQVRTAIQAVEHGAFRYLSKGTDASELERVLDEATCIRRAADAAARNLVPTGSLIQPFFAAELQERFDRCLDSFWLAYQPIVDCRRRAVHGYEALLRSGERGLPHPNAVFDAAHRLGRIDELGRAIRERASCGLHAAPPDALLFVNLLVSDLADPALSSEESPLSKFASRVVLEITERASIDEVKDAQRRVARLRELGYRIAIDDMGSGYAGLTSFALLEPEYVKLDMSLVRDIELSATKQKVVVAMTSLCRDLGIQVIAEGVETVEERDTLREAGCDILQGFLFAKPNRNFHEVEW